MRAPKLYPIRKLKKKARERGIEWFPSGPHGKFKGPDIYGEEQTYPLPSAQHKKEVTGTYLRGFLRRFGLGEDFFND